MKKLFTVFAVGALLPLAAGAAVVGGPVAPGTSAVWAGLVGNYLNSPTPDLSTLSGVLPELRALDMTNPAIRASMAPVTALVQAAAARSIKGEEPPEKAWVIATAFRGQLTPEQQAPALTAADAAYAKAAAGRREGLDQLIARTASTWSAGTELPPALNEASKTELPVKTSLGATLRRWAGLKPADPKKNQPAEWTFVDLHGAKIAETPGVVSVKAIRERDPYYGYNDYVRVEVLATADQEAVEAALEPYRFAGVDIEVVSRGWKVYEITNRGTSQNLHNPPLDPRMSASLQRTDSYSARTKRFVSLHGAVLRATPGVVSVKAVSEPDPYYGYNNWVRVEVLAAAEQKAVEAALEPFRFAGVDIEVVSRGWKVYEITNRGTSHNLHNPPLDPRMRLSLKALDWRDRTERFVALHGAALRAQPGVNAVRFMSYPVQFGEEYAAQVDIAPTADLAAIKQALEPYRFAGVRIVVMSKGWQAYHITEDAKSYDGRPALDPRMDLSLR